MTPAAKVLLTLILVALAGCSTTEPPPPTETSETPGSPSDPTAQETPATPSPMPTALGVDPAGIGSAPGVLSVIAGGTPLASGPDGSAAGTLREGVVVPFDAVEGGWARITTPCQLTKWMPVGSGERLARPVVVLDPGHGGNEPGAVGPTGLEEKDINLDVSIRAAGLLNSRGIPTLLARSTDYRMTVPFRVDLAKASSADLLVSIHHNAAPDGPSAKPGTETYFQYRSADSKRLAGLIYEEVLEALSTLDVPWVADTDAGAKWRLGSSGADYYGILRRSGEAGVTTALAEFAFLSNPAEEAALRRPEVLQLEAEALVRGIERFLTTQDPGSGFTTPYPREEPAGPGGGVRGCVDPA